MILDIKNLVVSYKGSQALRGVNLRLGAGEVTAAIGPNGAGKSTLLRTISGLVRASEGSIEFDAADVTNHAADSMVRRGIVHVPEGRMILTCMTVRDNLLLGGFLRNQQDAEFRRDFDHVLSLFPVLGERLQQLAGTLSGGEQQMLAIGRGLMGRPRLLMLDEPSLGLAPLVIRTIFNVIRNIRASGISVLLVEQNAEAALAVADHAYVLDLGRVVHEGPGAQLLGSEHVRSAYLGI